jgi:hypothetical protein
MTGQGACTSVQCYNRLRRVPRKVLIRSQGDLCTLPDVNRLSWCCCSRWTRGGVPVCRGLPGDGKHARRAPYFTPPIACSSETAHHDVRCRTTRPGLPGCLDGSLCATAADGNRRGKLYGFEARCSCPVISTTLTLRITHTNTQLTNIVPLAERDRGAPCSRPRGGVLPAARHAGYLL